MFHQALRVFFRRLAVCEKYTHLGVPLKRSILLTPGGGLLDKYVAHLSTVQHIVEGFLSFLQILTLFVNGIMILVWNRK